MAIRTSDVSMKTDVGQPIVQLEIRAVQDVDITSVLSNFNPPATPLK
jgi:hypothetical protein